MVLCRVWFMGLHLAPLLPLQAAKISISSEYLENFLNMKSSLTHSLTQSLTIIAWLLWLGNLFQNAKASGNIWALGKIFLLSWKEDCKIRAQPRAEKHIFRNKVINQGQETPTVQSETNKSLTSSSRETKKSVLNHQHTNFTCTHTND